MSSTFGKKNSKELKALYLKQNYTVQKDKKYARTPSRKCTCDFSVWAVYGHIYFSYV